MMKKRGVTSSITEKYEKNKLGEEPDFPQNFIFYWKAFFDLSSCRNSGMSLGSIPWDAIDRYCYRWNITDPNEFDFFVSVIRSMDSTFLKHHEEIREQKEKEKKRKDKANKPTTGRKRGR